MDDIGAAIGDAIADFFATPLVAMLALFVGAYLVVVWLASALWAFVDMRRRTDNPIAPYASAAVVILASPVLFPFALVVHRVVRPDAFISERRLSELRDGALEAEASRPRCPECRRVVDESWLLCPACRRPLGHRCHACGGTVGLNWPVCAWCGEPLEGGGPRQLRVRA
jgi:hypothetical protein